MNDNRLITASADHGEEAIDRAIRPRTLADYIGQPAVRGET
ncbi:MAG: hypothetical protein PHF20_08710 [Halothiobacillaceae bacterium]|nr:hypothetical protein [Halothiobacillaceae bacterium]